MADLLKLSVAERKQTGKGPNRRLRATGMVPGVYYDQKGVNIPVKVESLALQKAWKKVSNTQVIDLEIDRDGKAETVKAMIWRLKYDPIKPLPIHADFFGVDVEKPLKVLVPIVLEGRSPGVKLGGVLQQYRDAVEVVAKPLDIPGHITLDLSAINMGDKISVADLELPEGVEIHYDENFSILACIEKGKAAGADAEGEEEGEEEGGE
ncbi:50S ribosomal protein L25 [Salidesulfovibrio onnuriiensis]|uniref:50S ribosomal protein L25 n=1 Tax=Salidesulfovibrio onnuriiensis TaxID=2583823 RepID=UPI0011CA6BF1|nr:50S ribosomal protein L25 [Salidesulfovibrio onnuriiensis]